MVCICGEEKVCIMRNLFTHLYVVYPCEDGANKCVCLDIDGSVWGAMYDFDEVCGMYISF